MRMPLRPTSTAGKDPDYRQTFANERTFLAWVRTSLALVAGGVAVVEVLPNLSPGWARYVLGILLVGTGCVLAVGGLVRWVRSEEAMRAEAPLPRAWLPALTAGTVVLVGVLVAVLLISGALSRGS